MSGETPERFALCEIYHDSDRSKVVVSKASIGWLVDLLADAYIYRMQSIVDAQIRAAIRAHPPSVQVRGERE